MEVEKSKQQQNQMFEYLQTTDSKQPIISTASY